MCRNATLKAVTAPFRLSERARLAAQKLPQKTGKQHSEAALEQNNHFIYPRFEAKLLVIHLELIL